MAGVSPLFGVLLAVLFAMLAFLTSNDNKEVEGGGQRLDRPHRPHTGGHTVRTRSKTEVLDEIRSRPLVCDHRQVASVEKTVRQKEGGGFYVRRPTLRTESFDPFLLLDHLGPTTYGPKQAVGAPDHPHRGQETITYIIQVRWSASCSSGRSWM